jgi:hypothetical protein
MGNGLGGGGTSMPFFLISRVRTPIIMENEYGRILLETGVIGLLIWVAFIATFLFGSAAFARGSWHSARRVGWVISCFYFVTGMMGLGMLTAIPQTVLMLLAVGWVMARPAPDPAPPSRFPPGLLRSPGMGLRQARVVSRAYQFAPRG